MRLNRDFLILFFLILFISFSFQEGRTDDKVYFSCGSDSSANGDTLYIPCNGTHDVRIKINFANDSAVSAITVPLLDECYDPASSAYIDTARFPFDSAYAGSRVENWAITDVSFKGTTHQVLYGSVTFSSPVGVGDGLYATMIYTVKDTGRICLDSLFFPPANLLEFVSADAFAWTPDFYADTFIIAARAANSFPDLTLPADVDTALTSPQNVCITGISATDSDAGDTIILEKIEGAGTFTPDTLITPGTIIDSICFLPDTAGIYKFVFKLSDQCPAEVYDTFYVTINMSEYPELTVPDDVDTFLCEPQLLCIDSIIATDPDTADSFVLEMLEGPGTFDPDTGVGPDSIVTSHCFTPANKDSAYRLIFQVTDSTGFSDVDTFYVSVDMEELPALTVPSDVDTCLPPGSTLCLKDIVATDPDTEDTLVLEKVSGPGTFVPDTGLSPITDSVCFDPASNDSTYEFVFKVTDSCDSTRQDTFYVDVNVNEPPVVTLPADIDTFLCDAQEICFDSLLAFDPDSGDTFIVQMVEGPGTFDPDTGVSPDSVNTNHCFTPSDKDSAYRFIFEVEDPCGLTDQDTFILTVDINEPPQFSAPETLWVIENSARADTFTAADPDSNTIQDNATVTLDPDCGVYSVTRISNPGGASGEWEISYEDTGCVDSVFSIIVDLRDTSANCDSKHGYDTTVVIIRSQTSYNNSPIVTVPGDAVASLVDTLELLFTAADPDSDVILDTSIVFVKPVDCGSTYTERLTPSGTPSGEWKVTFYTEGCSEGVYWIDLNLRDFLGAWGWDSAKVTLQVVDVPETSSTIISGFNLGQNYPNPFNARTGITFDIPYACHVNLKIYNLTGQLVKTLVDREMYDGTHTVFWDGSNAQGESVASGIYFYKLNAIDFVSIKKMILLK